MRIIVLGYIVRGPLGGLVWHHIQYVAGLARLGHDVYFFEDSDDYESCYDPSTGMCGTDPTYGLRFTQQSFETVGLEPKWAYFDAHTNAWMGPAGKRAPSVLRSADLLLNLSGVNPLRDDASRVPRRVLIDTDPVFTQARHIWDEKARARAAEHTHFFTFGEKYGQPSCKIPLDGFPWRATRQPLVLDFWTPSPGPRNAGLSTVMQWDSYNPVQVGEMSFGMKSQSFRDYFDLPSLSGAAFELAIGSASAPREELARSGWKVLDPLAVTKTPDTYREFIRGSKGEFTIAKHGYVVSRSGWFSERSAAYLATGRPVITQSTGFEDLIDTGSGLLSFRNLGEAIECVRSLDLKYEQRCRDARDLAASVFGSDSVLSKLLRELDS